MDAKARLPKFYYNTYRQYKENESIIVRWVHLTVAEIREKVRAQIVPPNGKARGGARKTQTRARDPDLSSPKFSFRKFIDLVQEIAASEALIPTSYLSLLELSIKQRKLTAAFYSPDVEVSSTNKSHMYAIQSYIQALLILKEAQRKRANTDRDLASNLQHALTLKVDADKEESIFGLSEAISQLAIVLEEETIAAASGESTKNENEWLRDNPTLNAGRTKNKKSEAFPLEEYAFVPENYFEPKSKKVRRAQDHSFEALRCFLLDLNDMRKYCRQVWNSVAPAGRTSHIAASFVTNKAVQLVKQMEYSLYADFPDLKDMQNSFDMLVNVITSQMPSDATEDDFYPYKEQMMFYTWNNLRIFSKLLQSHSSPILRNGYFGCFDPLADRENMEAAEKHTEDCSLLWSHWNDLLIANYIMNESDGSYGGKPFQFPGHRCLSQDLEKFRRDKDRNLTWALIFACQMQVDSVHARRRYLEYDVKVIRNIGRKMREEYMELLEDCVDYKAPTSTVTVPSIRVALFEIINWIERDPVTEAKFRNGYNDDKNPAQDDALWLQNPWLIANAISETTMDFFYSGTSLVDAAGFVTSAIHMWNMLKQTGYLVIPPDSTVVSQRCASTKDDVLLFDHLIDLFGQKVFSGPPPKINFAKSWELMHCARAEEFARDKRQLKKTTPKHFVPPQRSYEDNYARCGISETLSDLWILHDADYFPTKKTPASSQQRSSNTKDKHPLAATLDLANSELGQSATLPSQDEFTPRGPLLNLNLFKIHRLCVNIFAELNKVVSAHMKKAAFNAAEIALWDLSQDSWPYITGLIALTEMENNGVPSRVLLRLSAKVFDEVAPNQRLGSFLMREEVDEDSAL